MAPVRVSMLEKPSPWHPFTRLLNKWYLHCVHIRSPEACPNRFCLFSYAPYKVLPSINNIFTRASFFLFVSFSSHTISWACRSLREPRKFFQTLFLCIHFFVKYRIAGFCCDDFNVTSHGIRNIKIRYIFYLVTLIYHMRFCDCLMLCRLYFSTSLYRAVTNVSKVKQPSKGKAIFRTSVVHSHNTKL